MRRDENGKEEEEDNYGCAAAEGCEDPGREGQEEGIKNTTEMEMTEKPASGYARLGL